MLYPASSTRPTWKRMAQQFMVELGWLQERIFPLDIAHPRTTLSAHDLLELADDFYRFRTKPIAWPMGEPRYVPEVLIGR
jgi:hypothetical protein